ncbi:MAG: CinA family protein [Hyphomonadaceae bacterium]
MLAPLIPIAERIALRLKARGETVAVAESAAGGLISAALLSVPGASAYFLGGGVIYTAKARALLTGVTKEKLEGLRPASELYALLMAGDVRERFAASWGVAETGAAGPAGNPYGDAAGHACVAIAGAGRAVARTVETRHGERAANMATFALAALTLLEEALA